VWRNWSYIGSCRRKDCRTRSVEAQLWEMRLSEYKLQKRVAIVSGSMRFPLRRLLLLRRG
jgi:hypothetical protein